MSIETKLQVEIDERFDELADLKPDSKEYMTAVDGLTKLMDRAIELEKLEMTETHNEKQLKEERKARWIKNAIDVGLGVLPLIVTVWGAKAAFKFEETGTITTSVGRKFMDKLISKK